MNRPIGMTAYDRLFLASHIRERQAGRPGTVFVGRVLLDGVPDGDLLRNRLEQVLVHQPVLGACVDYSRLTARAYWRPIGSSPVDSMLRFADLAGAPSPLVACDALIDELLNEPQDELRLLPLTIVRCRLHDDRAALLFRVPHHLTDHPGLMALLRALDDPGCAAGASASLASDEYPPTWSRRYVHRLGKGLANVWRLRRLDAHPLVVRPASSQPPAGHLFRSWPAVALERVLARAGAMCSPGPLLHSRHFLIAAAQAIDDIADTIGLRGRFIVMPVALSRPRRTPRRFVAGNDLTVAPIRIDRSLLSRPRDLDEDLRAQLSRHHDETGEAAWVTLSFAGWLRIGHYRRLLSLRGTLPPGPAAVSPVDARDLPERWLGHRVLDYNAAVLPTVPPGMLLALLRCRGRFNIGCGYLRSVWPDAAVRRFMERFEERAGLEGTPIAPDEDSADPAPDESSGAGSGR